MFEERVRHPQYLIQRETSFCRGFVGREAKEMCQQRHYQLRSWRQGVSWLADPSKLDMVIEKVPATENMLQAGTCKSLMSTEGPLEAEKRILHCSVMTLQTKCYQ
jgi:hypothetical protein